MLVALLDAYTRTRTRPRKHARSQTHTLMHTHSRTHSPYDTMEEVIGTRGTPGHGSLREWGVSYRELDLKDGRIDWEALKTAVVPGEARYTHDHIPAKNDAEFGCAEGKTLIW